MKAKDCKIDTDFLRSLNILMVGNFRNPNHYIEIQIETLAKRIESFGVSVRRTTMAVPKMLKIWEINKEIYKCRKDINLIHVQTHSNWNFWTAVFSVTQGLFWGVPVVVMYYGGGINEFMKKWGFVALPVFRSMSAVVVASEFVGGALRKYGLNPFVIPHLLEKERWPFRFRTEALPRFLWVRTFHPTYNPIMAIRAFQLIQREVSEASLTLVGTGEMELEVRSMVNDLRLRNVLFMKHLSHEELVEAYDQNDIFLNTSSFDNQPVTILEALASGIPIISTNAGGIPYVFEDAEIGYLVPVNDHEAMAEKALTLLKNPQTVRHMSERSQTFTQRFCWPSVISLWCRLYKKVLKSD